MRRCMTSLLVLSSLVVVFFTTTVLTSSPMAHAASMSSHTRSSVQPRASGGGCGSWSVGGQYRDIGSKACINYSWPVVQGDGYVSFYPPRGKTVTSCTVTPSIIDANSGRSIASKDFGCVDDAQNGGQNYGYGPTTIVEYSGKYYSSLAVVLKYSDGSVSMRYSYTSPTLTV